MTQFGGYDYCTEKAMQYLTLEPGKVPEALKLYAEAFQAKLVDDSYEDQSVQLKILNSYVLITPWASASGSSDSFLELPTDLNSIRRIREDKRFVEIDRTRSTEDKSVMMKDPFGITFLLRVEKKKMTGSVVDHGLLFRRACNPIAFGFPQGISPNDLCTIKLTALFVTRYGMAFKKALKKIASTEFGFLNLNHIWRRLFFNFVGVYTSIVKPSKEVYRNCDFMGKALELFFHLLQLKNVKMGGSRRVMEVDAFTGGVDYFAYMDFVGYSDVMPRPQRRSVMIAQLGHTLRTPLSASWCTTIFFVSPEVLGIIKLTALFVARYGKRIACELMEKEGRNPLFSFLDPSDCGFPCYNMVVQVYSKVLKNFELVYTADIVLQRYFQSLWDEEKDEPKDVDDLYSFVECVDSFAQMEDEEFFHKMGTREAHVYPFHDQTSRVHSRPHVYHPFHDQTSPANVQEEEGPSSIEVCVPTLDGRVIIEIVVESFFGEKVASLKEKIVKVIQIPSKYLKLRGKLVGVLRDDKSLADNNVEAGEILIATWRFSRWEVQIT
ncbi:unnamed protein product [Brassica rapa]|uniref:SURP motif domain-containing protein n=1 Tax=Brassica campestris TaxID=3711 RepID=A0A8D9G3K4_BRACM|nr:unnamed protein product [Brassica rapa]